jgi:hypothetical protein
MGDVLLEVVKTGTVATVLHVLKHEDVNKCGTVR